MAIKSDVENVVWIIVFSTFILFFITLFLSNTNPNSTYSTSSPLLNSTAGNLANWLDSFNTFSNNTQTELSKVTPNTNPLISVFLIAKQFLDIPISFLAILVSGFAIIFNMVISFGGGAINGNINNIFGIIAMVGIAILIIRVVISIIKWGRTGEGER